MSDSVELQLRVKNLRSKLDIDIDVFQELCDRFRDIDQNASVRFIVTNDLTLGHEKILEIITSPSFMELVLFIKMTIEIIADMSQEANYSLRIRKDDLDFVVQFPTNADMEQFGKLIALIKGAELDVG